MSFDRVLTVVNLAATTAIGVGTIALALQGMRLTSEFNGWQRGSAVEQARDQKRTEESLASDRLKDRCIEIAKFATEAAQRSGPSEAPAILKLVGGLDRECASVGLSATAIAAAIVVKTAGRFDEKTVARAAMIVDAVGGERVGRRDRSRAGQAAELSLDPQRSRRFADLIISGALAGKTYAEREQDDSRPEVADAPASEGVVPERSEFTEDLALRAGAGLSVFWDSPVGPVRFDFSKVLQREAADQTETFQFSTSTRF